MAELGHAAKGYLFIFLIALLLVGLPIAFWLSDLVEANLRRQASDVNSIISSVRHYYANNVVGRILASPGTTKMVHNYKDYPGAKSQFASGKPENRLEGWRCSRHSGSVDFSVNQRQHIRIQIPAGLFWAHRSGGHSFHYDATTAGSDDQRYERRT